MSDAQLLICEEMGDSVNQDLEDAYNTTEQAHTHPRMASFQEKLSPVPVSAVKRERMYELAKATARMLAEIQVSTLEQTG